MKSTTHVYCTNCKFGEGLLQALIQGTHEPTACSGCYPYEPEDSVPLAERPNYTEITAQTSSHRGVLNDGRN